jgi:hypothetical protein
VACHIVSPSREYAFAAAQFTDMAILNAGVKRGKLNPRPDTMCHLAAKPHSSKKQHVPVLLLDT